MRRRESRSGEHRQLTGAGEQVPAAQLVLGCGSQKILGAALSPKTKIPDGGEKIHRFVETVKNTK